MACVWPIHPWKDIIKTREVMGIRDHLQITNLINVQVKIVSLRIAVANIPDHGKSQRTKRFKFTR
jgi:hypothetical protein